MQDQRKQAIFCLIILAISLLVPMPRTMNESFTCQVLDQQDPAYTAQATVTFSGRYQDYLIQRDRFTGTVTVEGVESISSQPLNCDISVYKYQESWVTDLDTQESLVFYGTEKMEEFVLWVTAPRSDDPDSRTGRYLITNPAMTLDEAYAIVAN